MANRIYIKLLEASSVKQTQEGTSGTTIKPSGDISNRPYDIDCPLMEDPQISYKSEITSVAEEFSSVNMISKLNMYLGALSNTASEGLLNISNLFDVPVWRGTKPATFSCHLLFYTKTDPKKDVWDKMRSIIDLTILTKIEGGGYKVPGISLVTAGQVNKQSGKNETTTFGKLVSIKIPGVISLNPAFIDSATPTYSRHVHKNGWPIWGSLEISVSGLYPATSKIFDAVESNLSNSITNVGKSIGGLKK